MKMLRHSFILVFSCYAWAGYQTAVNDNFASIDGSKWLQIGSVAAGSNGLTGSGVLISTVPIASGFDYDVRMTVHTSEPGPCTGIYSLYARSTPDNSTAYVLQINNGSVGLYKKVGNVWSTLSWLPSYCSDGTGVRLL